MADTPETDKNPTPPTVDEVPLETGAFVRLHSLNKADLNGFTGEVTGYSDEKERFQIRLDDDNNNSSSSSSEKKKKKNATLLVKQINLERIPLEPWDIRQKANTQVKNQIAPMARNNPARARKLLVSEVLKLDRCCIWAYFLVGQTYLCQPKPSREDALINYQRAVANFHAGVPFFDDDNTLRLRSELAATYGDENMLVDEHREIRKVLDIWPDDIHAKYTLGCNCYSRNMHDEAVRAWDTILAIESDPSGRLDASILKKIQNQIKINCLKSVEMISNASSSNPDQNSRREAFTKALSYVDIALSSPSLCADEKAYGLARKGMIIDQIDGTEKETEVDEIFRQARDINNVNPMRKSFVVFTQGRAEESRGDRAPDRSDERFNRYQKSLALYTESQKIHHEEATVMSHMRVQAKIHPLMESRVDPVTGDAVATPTTARGAQLNSLEDGPELHNSSNANASSSSQDKVSFIN